GAGKRSRREFFVEKVGRNGIRTFGSSDVPHFGEGIADRSKFCRRGIALESSRKATQLQRKRTRIVRLRSCRVLRGCGRWLRLSEEHKARQNPQHERKQEETPLHRHLPDSTCWEAADDQESIDGTLGLPAETAPLGFIINCRSKASLRTRRSK